MTKYFLILLLIIPCAFKGYCQKTPIDYLNAGFEAARKNNDSAALTDFSYIVNQFPSDILCSYTYYQIGRIYYNQGNNTAAIKAYRKSILAKYDERAAELVGSNYYVYKSEASYYLSDCYDKIGYYDSALYFMGLYDSIFEGIAHCAYEVPTIEEVKLIKYANINFHAKRIREAERMLLSGPTFRLQPVYQDQVYPSDSHKHVIAQLRELFQKYEQPDSLRSGYEKAISNYFFDTTFIKHGNENYVLTHCCIFFLGAKIKFYYNDSGLEWDFVPGAITGPPDRKYIIRQLKQTDLYDMIQKL